MGDTDEYHIDREIRDWEQLETDREIRDWEILMNITSTAKFAIGSKTGEGNREHDYIL